MPQGPLGERIPFEGVLNCWNDDHDLPDLLLAVSRSGKTGRLHFSNPEGDKTLDLKAGKIVFAESSSQDDGLGQYLLRTGKISLMDYTRVSKMVQPGKRLGALLVSENILSSRDLVPAVVGQVRFIILGLFRRTETWYRFKEEELSPKESITLDLSVPELILQGVRYVESWRRISKGVGNLESVYRQAAPYEKEWKSSNLTEGVRELIDMLAKPTSLTEICERATLPDFEACRYLWAMRSLGWIDRVEAATDAAVTQRPAAEAPTSTAPSQPARIPESLIETQVAMEMGTEDPKAARANPGPSRQPSIPENLVDTQVATAPPRDVPKTNPQPPAAQAPKPIPADSNQTQLAIEPPTTTSPKEPKPVRKELAHTQMYVEPPKPNDGSAAPRSTGEFMESILDGDNPADPEPPTPPPKATTPPPPASHDATQFFEGPSALEPPTPKAPSTSSPAPQSPAPPETEQPAQAPAGFEALALGDAPGAPAAPPTVPPAPPQPNPADLATQPSVQAPQNSQPPASDDGPVSFSDLALPDVPQTTPAPAEPAEPLPLVEADDVAPESAPYVPDEPLLPKSSNAVDLSKESLVPPRRRTDDMDPDSDGLGHVLGNEDT